MRAMLATPEPSPWTSPSELDGGLQRGKAPRDSWSWVVEQKFDGHRVLLHSGPDGVPHPFNRNGDPYAGKTLPSALKRFRFPDGRWVLDGELVGDDYHVFDLLVAGDVNLTHGDGIGMTLRDRRTMLETWFSIVQPPFQLVRQFRSEEARLMIQIAEKECLEGVVFKLFDSKYLPGVRSSEWRKCKFVQTVDVAIGQVGVDGKNTATLHAWHKGMMIEVGRCSLEGKPPVKMGDVVEVRYLYAVNPDNPRLVQPTLMRVRYDKVTECDDTSQFKYTAKEKVIDV